MILNKFKFRKLNKDDFYEASKFVKKEYHHKGIAKELFNLLKTEVAENNLHI